MVEECCKGCRYHKDMKTIWVSANEVLCRRYPEGRFKRDADWCGEWQAGEQG